MQQREVGMARMGRRRVMGAVGLAAVLLVSLAACSSDKAYDAAEIETKLKSSQVDKVGDFELGAATCPAGKKLTEGLTITCTLVIGPVKAPYAVKFTDVQGSKFHFSAKPAKAIIPLATAEKLITDNLNDAAQGATVTCGTGGAELALFDPGDRISCTLSLDGQSDKVELEVTNTKGNIKIVQ